MLTYFSANKWIMVILPPGVIPLHETMRLTWLRMVRELTTRHQTEGLQNSASQNLVHYVKTRTVITEIEFRFCGGSMQASAVLLRRVYDASGNESRP